MTAATPDWSVMNPNEQVSRPLLCHLSVVLRLSVKEAQLSIRLG